MGAGNTHVGLVQSYTLPFFLIRQNGFAVNRVTV